MEERKDTNTDENVENNNISNKKGKTKTVSILTLGCPKVN